MVLQLTTILYNTTTTALNSICILKENKPFLIAMPLGVVGEFKKDNELLQSGYDIEYITDTEKTLIKIVEL